MHVMQSMMELGIHSLEALELKSLLEKRFAIALPATLAFDYPTTSSIASFITGLIQTTPTQHEKYAYKEALGQTVDMIQERVLEILRSILGTDISIDQVLAPLQ